jgi:ribose transport system substrate-binding protein
MRKFSVSILIVSFIIVTLMMICHCGRDDTGKVTTIAFVMKTLNNPFFIEMQRGAKLAADSLGIQLLIQAAEREVDVEKQLQIVENLIQRQVSAICLTPSGSKEVIPAIVKANRAGIAVLIVDTRVDALALRQAGGQIAAFIGSDNIAGGRIAAEFIVQQLQGQGNVAILEGIPGHETGDARLQGFRYIIDRRPGISVVASQTANWERDQGYNVFQNVLQSQPRLDALFACNDMMALGAIEAIATAGKSEKIIVVGFDAVEDARNAIQQGKMTASVAQHPFVMGKVAVESALKLIKGQEIAPEIPIDIELITKDKL